MSGLIGLIKGFGLSSTQYMWLTGIMVIGALVFLSLIIWGSGNIFFTKIYYIIGLVLCGGIAVAGVKGYFLAKETETYASWADAGTGMLQQTLEDDLREQHAVVQNGTYSFDDQNQQTMPNDQNQQTMPNGQYSPNVSNGPSLVRYNTMYQTPELIRSGERAVSMYNTQDMQPFLDRGNETQQREMQQVYTT